MRKRLTTIGRAAFVTACGLIAATVSARAQVGLGESRGWVGELRLMAIDPGNPSALAALHHAGWLEADGRLLKRDDFPDLFAGIGLAWTTGKTTQERFAVPDLVDRKSGISSDNPYGVLGGGDLVTGGRQLRRPPAPQYFIYVGRDASPGETAPAIRR
jgi:Phage Tail Collar Domain